MHCWVQEAQDTVKGYFGMRKAHIAPLPNNRPMVIWLNNKPITQLGLLDQAFPLSLLTPSPNLHCIIYSLNLIRLLAQIGVLQVDLCRPALHAWLHGIDIQVPGLLY